ncbi:hypothetical protein FMUND_15422 [Fusarium mundagurra]|uniref:Uncharacterized protein n=1 Tax=Fusarium mundagurra TaxID=1567541 RepID=A0A8H5XPS6_9HYPO|nr:hypothetical protein FMUND_15422 [Fusarium mundagurra]
MFATSSGAFLIFLKLEGVPSCLLLSPVLDGLMKSPSSHQQQLALAPVHPRKTAGESTGRSVSVSGGSDGGERQVKGKGKQAEDVDTGASALPVHSCLTGSHFREEKGAFIEVDPETLEEESDEEDENDIEEEDEDGDEIM